MPGPVPPTDLPVEACLPELAAALGGPGVAVLQAPPGAGKSTIVPLRLLGAPWLEGGRIVVLQPRRIAARAAARRMASLLGEEVGATVGYRTRDERRTGPATRIEVVTEGILTRRLQHDPSLPGVGLVVFDEVHERNLQSDLALALTLDVRAVLRPELRVLAMSATLDAARFGALLGRDGPPAPVVSSEGRTFPVEVRWAPPDPRQRPSDAVAAAVRRSLDADPGDVLVFLAGAADIRRVAGQLERTVPTGVDVRPLFGALPPAEQDLALAPSPPGRRRVVLATDIAETSLTVEGVRVVVDSGQARSPRHDPRSGLTRLHTGPISRASADQRAGRAGRTGPGVAHRLWSEGEHAHRRPFAPPEIESVELSGLALELALWGTPVADLAFLDPPPVAAVADARRLLEELGAIDADGHATDLGRRMAGLPVHPRLARMVLAAAEHDLGALACTLAALLEERDVLRGRADELPADVADRVRLVHDRNASHHAADRAALEVVRRRSRELRRRVGEPRDVLPADELSRCGALLASAYPDRVAQARGSGRFRLRSGVAASLPGGDALVGEPYLVVAELDPPSGAAVAGPRDGGTNDMRIRLAAGLDEADLVEAAGASVARVETLRWDSDRDDLRRRTERRIGALVLSAQDGPAPAGPNTTSALIDHVRTSGLDAVGWRPADRDLQARVAVARRVLGDDWPDVGDDALLASLDEWLAPRLADATGRRDLQRVDMGRVLRDLVGHHRIAELDRLVPASIVLANGRTVAVDYTGEQPGISARAQDLFGTTTHPTVANGRVPLVVSLLSPAARPVQVTADLPGFWAGSWREVRKEMAGRYPKHDWPLDPASAVPPPPRRRR